MIMRLENIQVGKGQYLYKIVRYIQDTKEYKTGERVEKSGCAYMLRRTK